MSEKIYACLLRLFPSAFRRHYEEEALRLVRDRLSDETGFLRRLRLGFDLLTDMIGALPQAYRNSYAGAEVAASLTPHFDGVPSFRVLREEPIRRGVIVIAGVLAFTVLATFTYVMERPDRPAERNGPRSPIEAVLEHLNQPSPDSADNIRSDAPQPASTDIGSPGARPIPTTNGALSPGTRFVTSAARQPAQPSEQNPNTSYSDREPLRAVAAPPSPASGGQQSVQSQPEGIRVVAPSTTPSNLQVPAAAEANLSGRWTGSLPAVGGDADVPQWFIFQQYSVKLSGTGGPDSTEQYPIIDGLVAGDSVRFELNHGRKRFLYDLKIKDNGLRGTLSIRSSNEVRTAQVWLERAH